MLNLYELHRNKEKLDKHDLYYQQLVLVINHNIYQLDMVIKPIIMRHPYHAYKFARDVIGGRWIEAEPYIIRSPEWSFCYAQGVMKCRWREAEPRIMTDPYSIYRYAHDVIKERWIEAEKYMRNDHKGWWNAYRSLFKL
jgi:hypothetical protein